MEEGYCVSRYTPKIVNVFGVMPRISRVEVFDYREGCNMNEKIICPGCNGVMENSTYIKGFGVCDDCKLCWLPTENYPKAIATGKIGDREWYVD